MNELIKVDYSNDRPTVLGRELHEALGVSTRYNDWFPRMCEYGFTEGIDFYSILSKTSDGGRPSTDHQLTLNMAKELCMIQRTDKGKQCRQYFLEVESKWNSDDMIMARALQITNKRLRLVTEENNRLRIELGVSKEKADYADAVCNDSSLFTTTQIAKDFGMSVKALNTLLNSFGVQYKSGSTYVLYAKHQDCGYTYGVNVPKRGGAGYIQQMKWTQKGKKFVYDLLTKNGFTHTSKRKER